MSTFHLSYSSRAVITELIAEYVGSSCLSSAHTRSVLTPFIATDVALATTACLRQWLYENLKQLSQLRILELYSHTEFEV